MRGPSTRSERLTLAGVPLALTLSPVDGGEGTAGAGVELSATVQATTRLTDRTSWRRFRRSWCSPPCWPGLFGLQGRGRRRTAGDRTRGRQRNRGRHDDDRHRRQPGQWRRRRHRTGLGGATATGAGGATAGSGGRNRQRHRRHHHHHGTGGTITPGTGGARRTGPAARPAAAPAVSRPAFGTGTPAGRGGAVIKVTTLAASGAGSLDAALRATGPRIIVFEVGGIIDLDRRG